jgi:L-alanine-DL-glutamate epimerase-like enolase superfamily enzyme
MNSRRSFLRTAAGLPAAAAWLQASEKALPYKAPAWEAPLLDLHAVLKSPVKIASMELLRNGNDFFVRTRSTDGVEGLIKTKDIEHYTPIFVHRVAPFFIGQDARDLEALVDGVYTRNYKLAGQPFWCPVAYAEQSALDLLGKTAKKPVGALLGKVIRKEVPVYLSGSGRETTGEEEVDVYIRAMEISGAKSFKLKIGARMSRNADVYPGRTEQMLELARKRSGDGVALYADANGSYDAAEAIRIGRLMEQLKYAFYEEPCPWEDYEETRRVADALEISIAGGECDHRLWGYRWMIKHRAIDIVQPDINYNGGFVRTLRVARMAREHGMNIVPHNTQTGPSGFNILQFASVVPNIGPHMEYPFRGAVRHPGWYSPHLDIRNGAVPVPDGPGMGVTFDPGFIAKARRLEG